MNPYTKKKDEKMHYKTNTQKLNKDTTTLKQIQPTNIAKKIRRENKINKKKTSPTNQHIKQTQQHINKKI